MDEHEDALVVEFTVLVRHDAVAGEMSSNEYDAINEGNAQGLPV